VATSVEKDQRSMAQWLGNVPDKEAVKNFVHGPGDSRPTYFLIGAR